MGLIELEKEGLVRRISPDTASAFSALARAEHDIRTARCVLGIDLDWSFAIAYDAGLQACLAVMLANGYRPRGFDRHRTAIRFAHYTVPGLDEGLDCLDDIRLRRHSVVYDIRGSVSESEVANAIETAEMIHGAVRDALACDAVD